MLTVAFLNGALIHAGASHQAAVPRVTLVHGGPTERYCGSWSLERAQRSGASKHRVSPGKAPLNSMSPVVGWRGCAA